MQKHRCRPRDSIGQVECGVDVIVVRVSAHDCHELPISHRRCDRPSVVSGVDDDHLTVVAQQPDVVGDLPGTTVQLEDAIGFDLLDADVHRTTTERSTSPRFIAANASSTSVRPIVSETNVSSFNRPSR